METVMNERIRELSNIAYKNHLARNPNSSFSVRQDYMEEFADLLIRQCAYYADLFEALGCAPDLSPNEIKPSDYIKNQFGLNNV
jgi:hypothetical protein